jgi:regulator of nucleoside diphosphate kinase
VFPTEANFSEGKISILAPIGTAILGYKRGDTIAWPVPSGLYRLACADLKLTSSFTNHEATGNYEL